MKYILFCLSLMGSSLLADDAEKLIQDFNKNYEEYMILKFNKRPGIKSPEYTTSVEAAFNATHTTYKKLLSKIIANRLEGQAILTKAAELYRTGQIQKSNEEREKLNALANELATILCTFKENEDVFKNGLHTMYVPSQELNEGKL